MLYTESQFLLYSKPILEKLKRMGFDIPKNFYYLMEGEYVGEARKKNNNVPVWATWDLRDCGGEPYPVIRFYVTMITNADKAQGVRIEMFGRTDRDIDDFEEVVNKLVSYYHILNKNN